MLQNLRRFCDGVYCLLQFRAGFRGCQVCLLTAKFLDHYITVNSHVYRNPAAL